MTSAGFADVAVVTRTRRRLAKRLAQAMLAFAVAPILLTLIGVLVTSVNPSLGWTVRHAAPWVWFLCWPLGVPAASIAAVVAGTRRRMGGLTVDADGSGLVLESSSAKIVAKRDAIESALVLEGAETGVELVLAGGDVVEVGLGDPASARAMVAALGLGAPDRRITVPLGTARAPLFAGCAGVALAVCASVVFGWVANEVRVGPWFALLVFVAATIVLARLLTPGRVVVGTDGILLEKAFRRTLFPRASIVDLSEERDGLYAVVDLGIQARRILVARGRSGARTAALAARIREVLTARGPSRLAASALLARGERSVAAWREGLRKLAGGARGYRDEAVSADALLQVAEDPDAPAEQRIGAAMTIGFGDDAGAKERLRVAAEGIADAGLAAAMERAAEGEAEAEAIDGALQAARRSEVR